MKLDSVPPTKNAEMALWQNCLHEELYLNFASTIFELNPLHNTEKTGQNHLDQNRDQFGHLNLWFYLLKVWYVGVPLIFEGVLIFSHQCFYHVQFEVLLSFRGHHSDPSRHFLIKFFVNISLLEYLLLVHYVKGEISCHC